MEQPVKGTKSQPRTHACLRALSVRRPVEKKMLTTKCWSGGGLLLEGRVLSTILEMSQGPKGLVFCLVMVFMHLL